MKNNKIILIFIGLFLFIAIAFSLINNNHKQSNEDVKIFFCKSVGNQVITEPVLRKIQNKEALIKIAIENLLDGPSSLEKDKGFFSEIPTGTRLINIKEEPDQVRINLNEQFISGGGTNSMVSRMKQLQKTALDAEPIRKVFVDIEGKQLEILGNEGLEITQPLSNNNE